MLSDSDLNAAEAELDSTHGRMWQRDLYRRDPSVLNELSDFGAEQAVLGSILLEPEAANRALPRLTEGTFYREAHREIVRAMLNVHARHEPVDLITVCAELRQAGCLGDVGGSDYLCNLIAEVPTTAHVMAYLLILERAYERRLTWALTHAPKDEVPDPALVQQELDSIRDRRHWRDGAKTIGEYPGIFDGLQVHLTQREFDHTKPHFGIDNLDRHLCGLPVPAYSIIMGDSSMGKTTLALQLLCEWCVEHRKPSVMYSAEMSVEDQLSHRLAYVLCQGRVASEEELYSSLARATEAPLYLYDTPGMSIEEVVSDSLRLAGETDLSLVVVDYLQLLTSTMGPRRERERLEYINTELKQLSKRTGAHVCALSQVTWDAEHKDSHSFGARGIEFGADLVLEVQRDGKTMVEKRSSQTGTVAVRKNRLGSVRVHRVAFNGVRFSGIDDEDTGPTNVRGADRA